MDARVKALVGCKESTVSGSMFLGKKKWSVRETVRHSFTYKFHAFVSFIDVFVDSAQMREKGREKEWSISEFWQKKPKKQYNNNKKKTEWVKYTQNKTLFLL